MQELLRHLQRLVVCPLLAGVAQTSDVSGSEEQQCQRPEDDLEVMPRAATGGYFCISPFETTIYSLSVFSLRSRSL